MAATDTEIALRVPPIDKTRCDADTDIDGVNVSHRNNVGVYGPEPAHDHTSWTGTGGVDTPLADGTFDVSSSGVPMLQLDIACGYDDRLDEIPDENFPTGVSGAPEMYWYRKADIWRAYDGANQQDGDPWSCPAEGVYCWLGWPFVKFAFPTIPAACTLDIVLRGRTYTYTRDNHLSDSTRQTTFEYDFDDTDYHYTIDVMPDQEDYELCLVTPTENTYPRYERVVWVQIQDFADGSWEIGEPNLILDTEVSVHSFMKAFESVKSQYRVGGLSAHADAAYESMYCGDETKANHAEDTLPNFDYVEGAVSGLDLTTIFSIGNMCTLIQNSSDAWTASKNTSNWDDATLDDEDNRLTNGYAFDICYPEDEFDDEPLEQGIDDAIANASLRCGTWNIVKGVTCRVLPDKVCGGRAHGNMLDAEDEDRLGRSQVDVIQMWRRKTASDDWATYASPFNTDDKGHWCSPDLPEVDPDTGQRWLYGAGLASGSTPSINFGNVYTREFLSSYFLSGLIDVVTEINKFGTIFRGWVEGVNVKLNESGWMASSLPEVLVGAASAAIDAIWLLATGSRLMIGASLGGGTEECWLSNGNTLGPFYTPGGDTMSINHGLSKYTVRSHRGMRYYVGYQSSSGMIVCRRYMAMSDKAVPFVGGGTTRSIAAAEQEVRPGFVVSSDGRLTVDVPGASTTTRYHSVDGGETWSEIPG